MQALCPARPSLHNDGSGVSHVGWLQDAWRLAIMRNYRLHTVAVRPASASTLYIHARTASIVQTEEAAKFPHPANATEIVFCSVI